MGFGANLEFDVVREASEDVDVNVAAHKLGFGEFVALAAGLMALNAIAIDAMLPALPAIGAALAVVNPNTRQWIVTAYIVGNGAGQLIYGVLADRFGRRPILLGGVVAYVILGTLSAFAASFPFLIVLRALHGVAAASTITVRSVVRDCYSGAAMARVSSLTFVVFLSVPVLAPSVGQLILFVGDWRWIFWFFVLFGLVVLLWASVRLPETLHPQYRRPISIHMMVESTRLSLTNRISCGYTLALTCMMGTLVGYIGSIQQIFAEAFHAPNLMAGMFALSAGTMGAASFMNAQIVERFGTRTIAHWALLTFIGSAFVHSIIAVTGHETVWGFTVLQAVTMSSFALAASNFGAIAMEPLGSIAGSAASIQGVISTLGGSVFGAVIGQHFDGTTIPLTVGATLSGFGALACVLVGERGRLFRPEPDDDEQTAEAEGLQIPVSEDF